MVQGPKRSSIHACHTRKRDLLHIQSTPDNSNLQGKSKKFELSGVRVIESPVDGFHSDVIKLQSQNSEVLRILIFTGLKVNKK